jgi:hypothetical protein
VLVVFAFLLYIAAKSGFTGIPLAFILTSWFFKYAYVLFDHTVRGFDDPPALDVQMVNPFNEQRPLAQLLILALICAAVKLTSDHLGTTAAVIVAGAAALLLPASVAVLGLESNILKAAYPVAWVRIVMGLGSMYALVLAIIAGYVLLIVFLFRWELWLPLQIAIFMFCILSIFSTLGGALYERRHELGLETWASPERDQARSDARDLRQSEHIVTEAYGQMRAGSHTQAWQSLQNWLAARGHAPDDYHWLSGRAAAWGDPRYLTRLTQEHVERLLILKRSGEALDVVAQRLHRRPRLPPQDPPPRPCKSRASPPPAASPNIARTLLADFPTRFAGDPSLPAAADLARHLGP